MIKLEKVKNNGDYVKVKGHVTVEGCKYKFTVLRKKENKTSQESWNVIAEEAAKIALKLINEKTLYKATVVLSGIPDEANSSIQPNIGVKKVEVKKKEKSKFKTLKINSNKIDENIKKICEELKSPGSTKKNDIASSIPKINIAGDGRCLDRSIVYQVLAKQNPNEEIKGDDERISLIANILRQDAAKMIQSNDYDVVPEFFNCLYSSIREIPAFWKKTHYENNSENTNKNNESLKSINRLLTSDTEINEIENILVKMETKDYEFSKLTDEEKNKLKDFYARYITQSNLDNNGMNNYLDSAFLYVLPYVNINNSCYQYAVLGKNERTKKDEIRARFPKYLEFKADNTIFILYSGGNHYDPVDMNKAGELLNKIISAHNSEIVANLFKSIEKSSVEITKAYLLNDIKNQVPEAYKAIANYIYWHDHGKWKESVEVFKEWEKSDKSSAQPKVEDEPGTKSTSHLGVEYLPTQYGDYRLNTIEARDLKKILDHAKDIKTLQQLADELKKKEESEQK